MRIIAITALVCVVLSGCKQNSGTEGTATPSNPPKLTQAPATGGSSSGGITPIGPNVGAMTPVAGGDDLGSGTGGGIAQMAKARAKQAAGQASTPTGTGDSE